MQKIEYEQLGIEDLSEFQLAGIEPTSTALAMGFTRFYSKQEDGRFKEANLRGILCFTIDRKRKSRYF